jgi:hypothetical protein
MEWIGEKQLGKPSGRPLPECPYADAGLGQEAFLFICGSGTKTSP